MRGIVAHSLLVRTVALICAPLLLAVAMAVAGAINVSIQDARHALSERAQQTVALLAGGAGDALWNLDRKAARAILRPLSNDPDFAGAQILDADGGVFVKYGDTGPPGPGVIVERAPLLRDTGNTGASAQRIGTMELRLATSRAETVIMERARTIAFFGFGLLLAVCGLLAMIVRSITDPIRTMTGTMAALAAGTTDVSVPATKRLDEIGRMAVALGTLKEHAIERLRFIERQSHLMEEIERTVEQRTQELRMALDTLQKAQSELLRSEKMAALGGMVAAMAHEINTPLGNGLTVATTLGDKIEEFREILAGKELRRSVLREYSDSFDTANRLLIGNLTRAAELIGSFKRVAVDQTSELRRSFELDVVCDEVVAMLRPAYKHTRVAIVLDLPPGIVLDSYPGALGQILTNLVSNAVLHGFGEGGAGTVRVAATAGTDKEVTLTVSDDGSGIPLAILPRIFDPFFTTSFGAGGSGLGFPSSSALAPRVLGGATAVTSTVGGGTTSPLVLPVTAPGRAPPTAFEAV